MADRYEKIRVIGVGTFGRAWLVRSKSSRRRYVMKEVPYSSIKATDLDQSLNEVKILSSLRHVNIIAYREAFVCKAGLVIAMEYADAGDLAMIIKAQNGEPFTEKAILRWFVQMLFALEYLHSKNILHRDLKTQNIFLTSTNVIKLGDFGVSKILDDSLCHARTTIGTPYYLSPEICRQLPYNHKTDIWSAGCVLYELATFRHPFEARDFASLVVRILAGRYEPIDRNYSTILRDLVHYLLQSRPVLRPGASLVLSSLSLVPYIAEYAATATTTSNRPRSKSVSPSIGSESFYHRNLRSRVSSPAHRRAIDPRVPATRPNTPTDQERILTNMGPGIAASCTTSSHRTTRPSLVAQPRPLSRNVALGVEGTKVSEMMHRPTTQAPDNVCDGIRSRVRKVSDSDRAARSRAWSVSDIHSSAARNSNLINQGVVSRRTSLAKVTVRRASSNLTKCPLVIDSCPPEHLPTVRRISVPKGVARATGRVSSCGGGPTGPQTKGRKRIFRKVRPCCVKPQTDSLIIPCDGDPVMGIPSITGVENCSYEATSLSTCSRRRPARNVGAEDPPKWADVVVHQERGIDVPCCVRASTTGVKAVDNDISRLVCNDDDISDVAKVDLAAWIDKRTIPFSSVSNISTKTFAAANNAQKIAPCEYISSSHCCGSARTPPVKPYMPSYPENHHSEVEVFREDGVRSPSEAGCNSTTYTVNLSNLPSRRCRRMTAGGEISSCSGNKSVAISEGDVSRLVYRKTKTDDGHGSVLADGNSVVGGRSDLESLGSGCCPPPIASSSPLTGSSGGPSAPTVGRSVAGDRTTGYQQQSRRCSAPVPRRLGSWCCGRKRTVSKMQDVAPVNDRMMSKVQDVAPAGDGRKKAKIPSARCSPAGNPREDIGEILSRSTCSLSNKIETLRVYLEDRLGCALMMDMCSEPNSDVESRLPDSMKRYGAAVKLLKMLDDNFY